MTRPRLSDPIVSVIMPFHNGARHLRDAIASVLAQSETRLELLLCDDASTDASPAIAAQAAAEDPRVRVLRSDRRGGPGAARNRGLDAARGAWIAIVDADDLVHPRRLERMIRRADELNADIVAEDLIFFGGERGKSLLAPLALQAPWRVDAAEFLAAEAGRPAVSLGYLKPVIRRRALGSLRYRPYMTVGEDFDLLFRLLLSGAAFAVLPEAYYLYRRHSRSISYRLPEDAASGMLVAMRDLARDMPDATARLSPALAERRRRLESSLHYARLVARVKRREIGEAAGILARRPLLAGPLMRSAWEHATRSEVRPAETRFGPPLGLASKPDAARLPPGFRKVDVPERPEDMTAVRATALTALASAGDQNIRALGRPGLEALGYVPGWRHAELVAPEEGWTEREAERIAALPWPVTRMEAAVTPGLVHVRTPTFRRPAELRRCLDSLRAQTHDSWICDVFDDDPEGSAQAVVAGLGDPRIRYRRNPVQNFASRNIDQCFGRSNPHGAEYFCVLEDDNFLLPDFLAENIRIARETGVEIVFRNQLVEFESGAPSARLSERGLLDRKLTERIYEPDHFRLALMADIGVSNGGLFWSCRAKSDLEVHFACSATLQEYYRTFAIEDPILVVMRPLAVWAENGGQTTRNLGNAAGWFWRELALKATVARLQRLAWRRASPVLRAEFLNDAAFSYPRAQRARGLVKTHLLFDVSGALPLREIVALALRGALIRVLGRPEPGFRQFVTTRSGPAGPGLR